jgi:Kef-type K+ transport system membrane component KefB
VGLIVAGIGVSSGDLSSNVYTAIIIMVAVTTVITPVWLKKAYSREPAATNETSEAAR